MTLGQIVYNYRVTHGYSQRQFALRCGISNQNLSVIEREQNPATKAPISPSISMIKKLADGMNMTAAQLMIDADDIDICFDDAKEPPINRSEVDDILIELRNRPEMRMLFSLSRKATKKEVEDTVRILEALKNGREEV